MLVIYLRFSDVTAPATVTPAWIATRFFGPYPSVVNYFADDSFNRLILTAAPESDTTAGGVANDGVVTVDAGTWATFSNLSEGDQDKKALESANPSVNYATFDQNNNGQITDDELVVQYLEENANTTGGCGATRGVTR